MGKLLENELTKMLLDTMDEFRVYKILPSFLELVEISISQEDSQNARFENFKFFDEDKLDSRREIDGIIEIDSALIFIESKQGNNKHSKDQLIQEFRIGNAKAKAKKIEFYIIAIDENITEPSVIETVRSSTYAGIKREQIKWISWHEITRLLSDLSQKIAFDSPITRSIFMKRVIKYKEQGFKSFEGFDKSRLNTVSKTNEYLKAFASVSAEVFNLVKGLQIALFGVGIKRIYKGSEHWRNIKGKRKKTKTKRNHLYWKQTSVGIGNRQSTIVKSYTFPFCDTQWAYDLSKSVAPYYLFLKFDFEQKKVFVGYSLQKAKVIKEILEDENKFLKALKQFSFFQRKPLYLYSPKLFPEGFKASDLKQADIDSLKKATRLEFAYSIDMVSSDLQSSITTFFTNVHKFVVSNGLIPKPEKDSEPINVDESVADEEITPLTTNF